MVEGEGRQGHRPLWIVLGIGCGGCLVVVVGLLAAVLLPIFSRARQQAQRQQCLAQLHQLAVALRMYQADYNDRFPQATTWRESMARQVTDPNAWHCPADRATHSSSYAFNANLSALEGAALSDPARVVVLFESTSADPNPSDLGASWPRPGRHPMSRGIRGNNVAYADERAESKASLQPRDLQAGPGQIP